MTTATIENNIIEVIAERLREFTEANGYDYDAAGVVRPDKRGEEWTVEHRLMLVDVASIARNPEHDRPGNPPAVAYMMTVEARMILRSGMTNDAVDSSEAFYAAAVMKKLIATGSQWWQFDDNAYNADIGEPNPFRAQTGDYSGVTVPVTVWFRVSENNPFQSRS